MIFHHFSEIYFISQGITIDVIFLCIYIPSTLGTNCDYIYFIWMWFRNKICLHVLEYVFYNYNTIVVLCLPLINYELWIINTHLIQEFLSSGNSTIITIRVLPAWLWFVCLPLMIVVRESSITILWKNSCQVEIRQLIRFMSTHDCGSLFTIYDVVCYLLSQGITINFIFSCIYSITLSSNCD